MENLQFVPLREEELLTVNGGGVLDGLFAVLGLAVAPGGALANLAGGLGGTLTGLSVGIGGSLTNLTGTLGGAILNLTKGL